MDHLITAHGACAGADATQALQAAIDAAAAAGGGRVVVPPGTWTCGTVTLRSRIELHLAMGALLRAADAPAAYVSEDFGGEYGKGGAGSGFLLRAHDCEDVAITGLGCIDGHSLDFMQGWRSPEGPYIREPGPWRPRGIGLTRCRRVTISGITIRDWPLWTLHLTGCEDVLIHGIRILNRLDVPNCDGIDPDRCRRVRIIGCHIEAGDDGIVLKNTRGNDDCGGCEDIVVQGCTIISTSAAIKIGTESQSDFRRIVINGCVISGSHRGLALQLRDGGSIEDVIVSDCVVQTRRFAPHWWGQGEAIAVTAVPRNDATRVGRIRNIVFRNIRARCETGVVVHGWPGSPIEGLVLDGVALDIEASSRWPGGRRDLRPCQGQEHGGLEDGDNPAVLIRHAPGTVLRGLRVAWHGEAPWWSHAIDAASSPGVEIHDLRGGAGRAGLAAVHLA